jgi:hypothetical protein
VVVTWVVVLIAVAIATSGEELPRVAGKEVGRPEDGAKVKVRTGNRFSFFFGKEVVGVGVNLGGSVTVGGAGNNLGRGSGKRIEALPQVSTKRKSSTTSADIAGLSGRTDTWKAFRLSGLGGPYQFAPGATCFIHKSFTLF